jgi:hypothetical protein
LAKGERHRILKVSAANLHDVLPGLTFGGKSLAEFLDFRQESVLNARGGSDVDCSGEGVVGRLRAVDVIVGVDRLMAA